MRASTWAVLLVAAAGSGCNAGAPAPQHPTPSRSGAICDSVRASLVAGDSSIVVEGPFIRAMVLPPADPPADLAGRQFTIQIWVDETGQATVDTLTVPSTTSRAYRQKFLTSLRGYRFWPAVAEGCAVPEAFQLRLEL